MEKIIPEQITEEIVMPSVQIEERDEEHILNAARTEVEVLYEKWKYPSDQPLDGEKSIEGKGRDGQRRQKKLLTQQSEPVRAESRAGNSHISRRGSNNTLRITGEVLAGAQAYGATVERELPSDEDIRKVEAKAREGSYEARARLTEICLRRTWMRALRLSAFYKALRGVELDPQDIAQEGALRAWKRLDKALSHPNPYGYLCLATEGAMLTFCRERQSAVRVPVTMQWRGHAPVEVVSLDAQLNSENKETLADTLPAESEQV